MINLKILTSTGDFIEKENCSYINIPGKNGDLEIHPLHMKYFIETKLGIINYCFENTFNKILISNSYVFIDYSSVLIFCEFFFLKNNINLELEKNNSKNLIEKISLSTTEVEIKKIEKELELSKFKIQLF